MGGVPSKTPLAYLQKLRIEAAKKLLEQTSLKIAAVSAEVVSLIQN
jgi:transcriptional regulator GlxA family with amidase domain